MPQPFGGKYRQIMVYVDPAQAGGAPAEPDGRGARGQQRQPDPARRATCKIGPLDYTIYHQQPVPQRHGHQRPSAQDRRADRRSASRDIGHAEDAQQIQTNIVRVDGQPSVYLPVLKQGGDTNTIAVVDGVKDAGRAAVRRAEAADHAAWSSINRCSSSAPSKRCCDEGGIGLVLTSLMVLVFLGSLRATVGGVPLDPAVGAGGVHRAVDGRQLDQHHGAGRAGAGFSRLIDNSVVVLENIFRHLEMGEVAGGRGGEGRRRKSRCRCWRRR